MEGTIKIHLCEKQAGKWLKYKQDMRLFLTNNIKQNIINHDILEMLKRRKAKRLIKACRQQMMVVSI